MRFHKLALAPIAVALMMSATFAVASTLTFQGVTFASSSAGNVLTIEIDAAGRTDGWATAEYIDTIAIKDVGTYSSVSLLGPGGAWTYSANELNANGCNGGVTDNACFSHTPVALGDDMIFNFTFTDWVLGGDTPHLKVRFLDANLDKQDSLLSEYITTPIPEPETYAMLLAGLGLLGWHARRRKKREAV